MINFTLFPVRLFCFVSAVIFMIGCDNSAQKSVEVFIVGVPDLGFMFNDAEEGRHINFKSGKISHCGLSFIKSKLVQGTQYR